MRWSSLPNIIAWTRASKSDTYSIQYRRYWNLLLQPLSERAHPGSASPLRPLVRAPSASPDPVLSDPASSDPATPDSGVPQAGASHGRRRWPRRRRLVLLIGVILCALVLLSGIGVGVMLFLTSDTSTPYRIGQALEQFKLLQRRNGTSLGRIAKGLPGTGVYMYSTAGSESAHAPSLPSSGAQYPKTTAMTVFAQGCGEDWRWQPLTDREEDLSVCRSSNGSLMLQSRFDSEQFYRDNDTRNFACTPDSVLLPADPRSGATFGGQCTNSGNKNSGGLVITYSGVVAGDEVQQVGGVRVPTVHLELNEKFTGDTIGSGTESLWLDSQSGLVVKETRTEKSRSQSVVGWVPSEESFSLDLLSVHPKT